jgi:hypothetical protein
MRARLIPAFGGKKEEATSQMTHTRLSLVGQMY